MNPVWVIAKKEIGSFFNSLVGYMIVAVFLILSGLFTWLLGNDIFMSQQANLNVFFGWAQWILLLVIPAITMKQIAEENKTGTIELLLTKALSIRQLVLGKFLACLLMVGIIFLFTLPYYFSVAQLGDVDHGAIISGYIGLLVLSAAYIAIGLFASSLTSNQIVAFLLALFLCFWFQFIFGFLGNYSSGIMGDILSSISMGEHYNSLARGVIDTKDLVYFGSVIFFFLFWAEINVSKK